MLRRTLYLITALSAGTLIPARAATIVCTLQTGSSGPSVNQACDLPIYTPNESLNWGTVLPATSQPVTGGSLTTSVGTTGLTVTANGSFQGIENAALAWNGSAWVQASSVDPNVSTFSGQFNSATAPAGPAGLGDNLLGVVNPTGSTDTNVTFSFAQTINYIEFQVSNVTGTDSDFNAQLVAYDPNGNVLGTYSVMDTGGGGQCAGLSIATGPQPCNDAPLLQFYDPEDNIASVELTMSDPNGVLIDSLEIDPPGIPEPSTLAMFSFGLLALIWAAKRRGSREIGTIPQNG